MSLIYPETHDSLCSTQAEGKIKWGSIPQIRGCRKVLIPQAVLFFLPSWWENDAWLPHDPTAGLHALPSAEWSPGLWRALCAFEGKGGMFLWRWLWPLFPCSKEGRATCYFKAHGPVWFDGLFQLRLGQRLLISKNIQAPVERVSSLSRREHGNAMTW